MARTETSFLAAVGMILCERMPERDRLLIETVC